jgi:hypothetical protein
MQTLYSMPLYMLFGWYENNTIQDAKIFGVFSSVAAANKVRDTYVTGGVIGFQLQRIELDEELAPPPKSRVEYTVVRDSYRGAWRPATSKDMLGAEGDVDVQA